MNNEQTAILEYLRSNAIGYNNKKSSTQIREDLNLASGGVTNEHVRDLILHHNACIGSLMWENGYWIIQTEKELEDVCKSLESRADSIRNRAITLRNSWRTQQNG